jgi:hypothetical protein
VYDKEWYEGEMGTTEMKSVREQSQGTKPKEGSPVYVGILVLWASGNP